MEQLPLKYIISRLDNDLDMSANIELARRVSKNLPNAVIYYISDLSKSIIDFISYNIIHRDILSEYYIFLSSPYTCENLPMWKKVVGYKGYNNCSLKTYTSNISCRHFCKVAQIEKKESQAYGDLFEFMNYEDLLKCDTYMDESENRDISAMSKAFLLLNERDKMILKCLVIDKTSSLDAYEILNKYIKPRPTANMTSDEVKASLTIRQKQNAISLLKGRALLKLHELYWEEIKNSKYV